MKFRNGKHKYYDIYKLMDGEWWSWDGPFTKRDALKKLKNTYGDLEYFAVVQVESTVIKRGTK